MTASAIFPRERVTVVGVLNTTPDSFSDGGRLLGDGGAVDLDAAVAAAARMIEAGAQMIDVGGESTRPGALETPLAIEIDRTVPVVEALAKRFAVTISIDTRKAAVAAAALGAGARVVNDVSGLGFDSALAGITAVAGASLILGHLRGTPESMQRNLHFDDVLGEVAAELGVSLAKARAAGIPNERLAVDPGIGFGKRLEDNLALLANAGRLGATLGMPVMVGPSRKAFLGSLTGDPIECRDLATAAACAVAIFAGADAVRVHDVAGAVRAAAVAGALRAARRGAIA
ncbi:MAG TPA: dihydropteroate synthase [Myxococcota bacterium]